MGEKQYYLQTLAEAFQVYVTEFSTTMQKTSRLFVSQCSLLNHLKKKKTWKNSIAAES